MAAMKQNRPDVMSGRFLFPAEKSCCVVANYLFSFFTLVLEWSQTSLRQESTEVSGETEGILYVFVCYRVSRACSLHSEWTSAAMATPTAAGTTSATWALCASAAEEVQFVCHLEHDVRVDGIGFRVRTHGGGDVA